MYITWLGQSCFKIQGKDATVVTDPYDSKIGLKMPKVNADIVTISHDHYDHNNKNAISGQPLIIELPGEYEIKKVFIWGLPSWHDSKNGSERGSNTIYLFRMEEIRIAHLGDLGSKLEDDQLEKLEGVDILMVPVGGKFTLDAKAATDVVNQLEPRIVIPMHFRIPGLKIPLDTADAFYKEMGMKKEEALDKFKVTVKDLPVDETKIITLLP